MTQRTAFVSVGCLALALAGSAFAQDHNNHRRGQEVPTAYAVGDVDAVNLWNGNLTISIPIGNSYPVGGGLSYSLVLSYNSTVWNFEEGPYNEFEQATDVPAGNSAI